METSKLKIFYRISDGGYNKVKPQYINNENCLRNFVKNFGTNNLQIVADNVSNETYNMIQKYVPIKNIEVVSIGNGAGSFHKILDDAIRLYNDDTVIYFVEDDYIHRSGAFDVLLEGITKGFDYITLYDHPDKYMYPENGGNKFCVDGSEETRVYFGQNTHWKLTNSTTFTFAGKVKSLKEDYGIFHKYTNGHHPETGQFTGHPYDFSMWLELRDNNRTLASPIPGYATHGETRWLSPCINWENEII